MNAPDAADAMAKQTQNTSKASLAAGLGADIACPFELCAAVNAVLPPYSWGMSFWQAAHLP
jgi:hypothetical protein